jgi:hypothetical protein
MCSDLNTKKTNIWSHKLTSLLCRQKPRHNNQRLSSILCHTILSTTNVQGTDDSICHSFTLRFPLSGVLRDSDALRHSPFDTVSHTRDTVTGCARRAHPTSTPSVCDTLTRTNTTHNNTIFISASQHTSIQTSDHVCSVSLCAVVCMLFLSSLIFSSLDRWQIGLAIPPPSPPPLPFLSDGFSRFDQCRQGQDGEEKSECPTPHGQSTNEKQK